MLFLPFRVYLIFTIDKLIREHCFYIRNPHFPSAYKMHILDHWSIDVTNLLILLIFLCFSLFWSSRNQREILFFKGSFLSRFLFFSVLQSSFLRVFSVDLSVIYCWIFCSWWSYQNSSILIIILGCDRILYVGHIQYVHTYLLPLKSGVISWQGYQLGSNTCWHQLTYFIDLKYPSSSSYKTSFVDFRPVYVLLTGSAFIDTDTYPWMG